MYVYGTPTISSFPQWGRYGSEGTVLYRVLVVVTFQSASSLRQSLPYCLHAGKPAKAGGGTVCPAAPLHWKDSAFITTESPPLSSYSLYAVILIPQNCYYRPTSPVNSKPIDRVTLPSIYEMGRLFKYYQLPASAHKQYRQAF